MNPFFVTDFSISDSLKTVRKSVLIYETIIIEAAHYFLNIPNDETKVRMNVVPTQEENRVVVRITFLTDGGQRMIEMIQPWGENGIWVPQNYLDSETDTTEISENAEASDAKE